MSRTITMFVAPSASNSALADDVLRRPSRSRASARRATPRRGAASAEPLAIGVLTQELELAPNEVAKLVVRAPGLDRFVWNGRHVVSVD